MNANIKTGDDFVRHYGGMFTEDKEWWAARLDDLIRNAASTPTPAAEPTEKCPECDGTGKFYMTTVDWQRCGVCDGTGERKTSAPPPPPPTTGEGEMALCPFCGGEPEMFECQETDNRGGMVIGCKQCGASTRVFFFEKGGKDVLLEAWNNRAAQSHKGRRVTDEQLEVLVKTVLSQGGRAWNVALAVRDACWGG